jgi:hypothetical protein
MMNARYPERRPLCEPRRATVAQSKKATINYRYSPNGEGPAAQGLRGGRRGWEEPDRQKRTNHALTKISP